MSEAGPKRLKKMFGNNPNMNLLIDSLWRELPGLYNEKYDSDPEKWLLNQFSELIDFGAALGQANKIEGNRSTSIGQGNNTKAFMELLLGAYATIAADQDPDNWVATDRLAAMGNGVDDETRSLVFEAFKSGLFKFFNAIVIGDFYHGLNLAGPGTIKYTTADGIFLKHLGEWLNLNKPLSITATSGNTIDESGHRHKIEGAIFKKNDGENPDITVIKNGYLYPFLAVADSRGLTTEKAHVPTDDEWLALATAYGGLIVAGGKMKETGTENWGEPNEGATNESGFTALPSGGRYFGSWEDYGNFGSWWTSTPVTPTGSRAFGVDAFSAALTHIMGVSNSVGLSIRLIVDTPVNIVGDSAIYIGNDMKSYVCKLMSDGKWWTVANLFETRWRTGEEIQEVTDDALWGTISGRCVWQNIETNAGTSTSNSDPVFVGSTLIVPTKLSQLADDETHRTVTDAEKTTWNGKQDALTGFLAGTKTYYVADTSGGACTRKLTFTNGILAGET